MSLKLRQWLCLFTVAFALFSASCISRGGDFAGSPDRSLVGANQAVNESLIVDQMRSIQRAEKFYKEENGGYATMDELIEKGMLNRDPGGHLTYRFNITADKEHFQCVATPSTYGPSGRNSYFVDETGEIRGADHQGKSATANDPAVN